MQNEKKDDDYEKRWAALKTILEVLQPLSKENRVSVLRAAHVFHDIRLGSGKDLGGAQDDCG